MKFILNKEDITYKNRISYIVNHKDIKYNIAIRNIKGYIELAIHSDAYDNRQSVLDAFCKEFNLSLIKDTSPFNNPYWNMYRINCDWSQFEPAIDECVKENNILYLADKLSYISIDELEEVLRRRKSK